MRKGSQTTNIRGLLFVSRDSERSALDAAKAGAALCGFPADIEVFRVDNDRRFADEWNVVAVPTLILHWPPNTERRIVGKFSPEQACQVLRSIG
jgi:hypothetical protein